jgi:hypothetical protein
MPPAVAEKSGAIFAEPARTAAMRDHFAQWREQLLTDPP